MEGWKEKKIEEVANFSKGKLTEQCEGVNSKWLPLLNAEAIITESKYYANPKGAVVCAENDILMLWDGERSGLVTIGKSGVVGSTFSKISLSNELDSQFCFYFLQNQYSWIQNRRTGTGVPHVAKDLPKILDISYPSSLIEQQEIARILITLDNTIKKTEQLIAKYKNIKQGLMHDLLNYGIDENGAIRNPQTHTFVEKKGLMVPEEWEVDSLGSCFDNFKSGINITAENIFNIAHYPVYGGNGLRGYTNNYTHSGKYVLIGRQGALCGNINVVTGENYISEHAIAVQTNTRNDIDYWYYKLDYMNLNQYSAQSAQPGLAVEKLIKLIVCIPQRHEQEKISQILNKQDSLIESEQTNLTKLQKLKQGLMADLLTGKVKVKTESV